MQDYNELNRNQKYYLAHREERLSYRREYYQKNKQAIKVWHDDYYQNNKDKWKTPTYETKRNIKLKQCYGLLPEDYQKLFEKQNGVCAILFFPRNGTIW